MAAAGSTSSYVIGYAELVPAARTGVAGALMPSGTLIGRGTLHAVDVATPGVAACGAVIVARGLLPHVSWSRFDRESCGACRDAVVASNV
jgi:hypothetical protein